MKRSKSLLVMLLILVMSLSLVLSACGNGEKAKDEPKKEVTDAGKDEVKDEEVEDEGEKVLRLGGMSLSSLNAHINSSAEDGTVQNYVTGSLLESIYDKEEGKVSFIGYHAEDLPETEDNVVWNFKLRDDIKWDDEAGTPITAETYVYSLKRLLDPKLVNRNAYLLYDNIKVVNAKAYLDGEVEWEEVGIKALDGNILQITMEDETPTIDVIMAFGGAGTGPIYEEIYEAGMNEDGTETDYGTTLDKFVASGKYRITEWVKDQSQVMEKIEDAPQADVFKVEKISQRVITEASTRIQLFENDEIDTTSVTTEYERFKEDPRVVYAKANMVWGAYVNTESETNPILKDKDFRQALFFGLDRDKISKGVFKVYQSAPYYISTIDMVNWETGDTFGELDKVKAMRPEGIGFEPDKAKELFDKAYEANGGQKISVELIYFEEQADMQKTAEVLKEEYENLFGADKFELKLRAMEPSTAYAAYTDKNYDLGIGSMTQSVFNPWSSMKSWTTDFAGKIDTFKNEEFDELCRRTTTGDLKLKTDERIEALIEMEKMLIDYVPQIPIFQNDNAQIYSDRIDLITDGEFIPGVGFAPLQSDVRGLSVQ